MRRSAVAVVLGVLVLALAAGAAGSEKPGSIKLRVIAETEEEITTPAGETETVRVEATTVVPGDEVIYTIFYTNVGERPADNVRVTNPIPEHLLYVDGSAAGEGTTLTFSVDGGNSYADAADITVRDEHGQTRTATATDYTHIRWTLDRTLESGEEGHVSFVAQLM